MTIETSDAEVNPYRDYLRILTDLAVSEDNVDELWPMLIQVLMIKGMMGDIAYNSQAITHSMAILTACLQDILDSGYD